jgi:glycosyltransferase involved in cell wall biosynthesis
VLQDEASLESLRILVLNWKDATNPLAGGAEVYTTELARRWVRWGHEVHLLCANYPGGKKFDIADGVRIHRLGSKHSVYAKAALEYLRKFRGRIDVVVDEINTLPWFTPYYVHESKIALVHQVARQVLFHELPSWIAAPLYLGEPLLYRPYLSLPFVTVSKSTKQMLSEFGIPSHAISLIPNGVTHIPEGELSPKDEKPLVAYVGRVSAFKRIDLAIEAMPAVLKAIPEARLVIAGRGDRRTYEKLMEKADLLGAHEAIDFLGVVSESEKRTLLGRAWVLVYPSVLEGWGQTILEANMAYTPAIATNVPGLKDSVVHEETGILVASNPDALGQQIIRVLADHDLRKKLSNGARAWAAKFSWETSARTFIEVIKDLLTQSPPARVKDPL